MAEGGGIGTRSNEVYKTASATDQSASLPPP